MKSNSKEVRKAVKAYVLDIIEDLRPEEWGLNPNASTLERLNLINEDWQRSGNYEYEQRRNPNNYARFKYWLLGLPSVFQCECYTFEIVAVLESWGLKQREGKPYPSDQSENLYFHLITSELEKIMIQNEINLFP